MDRMSQLETSSQQWKGRVQQSDAKQFTVAHKIVSASSTSSVPSLLNNNAICSSSSLSSRATSSSISSSSSDATSLNNNRLGTNQGSPGTERKKKSPQAKVFKSKTGGNLPELLGRKSPTSARKDFRRCLSQPSDPDEKKKGRILEVFFFFNIKY